MTVIPFIDPSKAQNVVLATFGNEASQSEDAEVATALVYCEGNFGLIDGKTANGLVRHSEKYQILSVIDSTHAGLDSGEVLDGHANGIPIYHDLLEAFANSPTAPETFIYGMAPATGMLSLSEREDYS